MKVKTLRRVVAVAFLAIGGVFAGKLISKKGNFRTFADTEKDYVCGDIIFGNTTVSSSYLSSTGVPSHYECSDKSSLKSTDFSLATTDIYSRKSSGGDDYPIKIGKNKGAGTLTITLKNNFYCDKVLIYAMTFPGHTGSELKVNDSAEQSIHTVSGTDFDFKDKKDEECPYTFTFTGASTISISTCPKVEKRCALVSKIVLRLYTVA